MYTYIGILNTIPCEFVIYESEHAMSYKLQTKKESVINLLIKESNKVWQK